MTSCNKKLKGGDWTYKLYFDPEADKASDDGYWITQDELWEKLNGLVDIWQGIMKVMAYKVPLSEKQLTAFVFYHTFIVFKTENWWWSIEKKSEGITIQRSKYLSVVKHYYRQKRRNYGVECMEKAEYIGWYTVYNLIGWLESKNQLKKKYNFLTSNCKHFASAVFSHMSVPRWNINPF